MNEPAQRLAGVLQDIWVDSDGVDVLIHGVVRTRNPAGVTAFTEVTLAVRDDDAPDLADAITEELGQLGATSNAIDDHDVAVDEQIEGAA